MVKSKQQRRANAKRLAAQARRMAGASSTPPYAGPAASKLSPSRLVELIDIGSRMLAVGPADDLMAERLVAALVDADGLALSRGDDRHDFRPEPIIGNLVVGRVAELWESGWQPADLVHVVRRRCTPKTGRLSLAAIGAEAASGVHRPHMPQEWADQLAALGVADLPTGALGHLSAWRMDERISVTDAVFEGLRLLGTLRILGPLAALCDPPSRWSQRRTFGDVPPSPRSPTAQASAKTLATIRALLAKAEGTTFPAEAEAFAAKAQELMTRHSIDAAMLDQRHGGDLAAGVRSRRLHIDNPYAKEKVQLLATVGSVNRVRVVYQEAFGMATVVGFPADLDITDMLFTSLLVQASRSLAEATTAIGRGSSPAFRRGFWTAYAVRIGERLDEADAQATEEAEANYGTSLVPVLAERTEAVASVVNQLFARTEPMKSRSVDAQGWYAGRTAADLASLGSTKPRLSH